MAAVCELMLPEDLGLAVFELLMLPEDVGIVTFKILVRVTADTGVDDPVEDTLEDLGLTDAIEELRIEPGPNSGESRTNVE